MAELVFDLGTSESAVRLTTDYALEPDWFVC